MSNFVNPRGPLPPQVYWLRRSILLAVALLVLLMATKGIGALVGSDEPATGAKAKQVAARPTTETSADAADEQGSLIQGPPLSKAEKRKARRLARALARERSKPAQPEGECSPRDITVLPYVYRAVAWRHSYIVLQLRTKKAAACTWRTSPETVTLRVTGPAGEVWTSRECPVSVPRKNLILRKERTARIAVVWSGRMSDSECTASTPWAPPGWYRIEAAAFAGEPESLRFELRRPKAEGRTPDTEARDRKPSDRSSTAPGESRPTDEPTGSPSGAVEP
ncbi:MAG: hypothetical protein ACRCYQ_07035 [Nocardioides sp.]